MSGRDQFISSLLQTPEGSNGPKIGVVGEEPVAPEEPEKTMMEIMMEEQAKAKKEKVKADDKAKDAMTKNIGSGFKKGFFGGDAKPKKTKAATASSAGITEKKTAAKSATPSTSNAKGIETLSKPKASAQAATKQTSLVLDDVQDAMKETNPMMEKLKEGEWMTPTLSSDIAANPILVNGLRNPKCMAAIKMMQENPKEAQKRFQDDPEVNTFLMEYGRVMSAHFEALGQQQGQVPPTPPPASSAPPPAPVQEIGPLHAATLQREKDKLAAAEKSAAKEQQKSKAERDAEARRVTEITNDKELSALLMDVELQKILQECGDPAKFQKYMRDPVIAYKIKKLFDAGLVGTAK